MKTMKVLPNVNEVIKYSPNKGITILAYVVNVVNNIYYLYAQNRLMSIEIQHTVENDSTTGDLYDEYHEINTNIICDYCIIPEADFILNNY